MEKVVRISVLLTIMGMIVMFQSCYTSSKLQIHSATAVTVDELNPGVRIAPFLCDYEVIPKNNPVAVYEEYNTGVLVESISYNIDAWISTYVTIAQSRMMKKHGADAILSVTSEATTNDKGELIVTVRGYPVKYTNFRPAIKEDLWMLDFEKSKSSTILDERTKTGTVTSSETIKR